MRGAVMRMKKIDKKRLVWYNSENCYIKKFKGRGMKISIHIHSEYSSDAKQSITSIIDESLSLGYDAIAITDHNTVAGSMAAAALKLPDIKIIAGAEFSTEKGHILALFIDDSIEKSCKMKGNRFGGVYDFDELVIKVRGQGGLLFLAHPLQSSAVLDTSFIERLDGYELINARINSSYKNKKANQLSKVLETRFPDKLRVGGSDAHTKSEIKSVYMTSASDDLKEALQNPDSIFFRKSSMTKIRYNNMKNHRKRRARYYIKQLAAISFGLLYDLSNKIKGDSYEVIRVRKESK